MSLITTRLSASLGGLSLVGALQNLAVTYLSPNPDADLGQAAQWRPPQWTNNLPSYTMLTATNGSAASYYFFDAVFRTEHNSELRITEHPVQTGANISDHAYQIPYRLTMEIGMSDAMDAYQAGTWQNTPGKSVTAYQTLLGLQKDRVLLSITTRLTSYSNMLIENIRSDDTAETQFGLKAIVTFRQLLFATAMQSTRAAAAPPPPKEVTSSQITGYTMDDGTTFTGNGTLIRAGRPDSTSVNSVGTLQTDAPSPAVAAQHNISSSQYQNIPGYPNFSDASALSGETIPSVPGAGTWSSNSLANLPNVF